LRVWETLTHWRRSASLTPYAHGDVVRRVDAVCMNADRHEVAVVRIDQWRASTGPTEARGCALAVPGRCATGPAFESGART